ncbi:MAG: hypothetical protein WCJ49_00930 [Deltaproteobacteria bacterium]|jgi:hypothetical protein
MSIAQFKVSYDGPALDTGRMDVKELAPALLAIGAIIEEGNRLLNPGTARIIVNVKNFEDGCFGISFEAVQTTYQQIIGFLSGEASTAAANLLVFLGFSKAIKIGLIQLIKITKGKKPTEIEELINGNIKLHFSDKDIEDPEIDSGVFTLYRDVRVRREIENAMKPLEKDGIEAFQVYDGADVFERVGKKEAAFFQLPAISDEEIEQHETIKIFSIHSLSFKEDNEWRLSDGTNTFFVTISDHDFLLSVGQNRIAFSKGDLLKIRLKEKTWQTASGFKTDYEALEILEHKKSFKQTRLM